MKKYFILTTLAVIIGLCALDAVSDEVTAQDAGVNCTEEVAWVPGKRMWRKFKDRQHKFQERRNR